MNYMELGFLCPQCNQPCTPSRIGIAEDGQIHLEGSCTKCGIPLTLDTTVEKQLARAHIFNTRCKSLYVEGNHTVN